MNDFEKMEIFFPPCGGGYIVAMRAYFDASIRESGVLSVAGFAFGMKNAKKATKQWKQLFGDKVCHMTDLHNRKREFSSLSKQDGAEIMHEVVAILKKYSSYAVAASFNYNDIAALLPSQCADKVTAKNLIKGYENPYSFACHTIMHLLGKMVSEKTGQKSSISYVFEQGDHGQKSLQQYANFVVKQKKSSFKELYCANSVVFTNKKGMDVLLQSADVLAWEWGKNIDRRSEGKPCRGSLAALLGQHQEHKDKFGFTLQSNSGNTCMMHFESDQLDTMLKHYRELFKAESMDDIKRVAQEYKDVLA